MKKLHVLSLAFLLLCSAIQTSCTGSKALGNSGCSISVNAANPGQKAQACIECDSLQRLEGAVLNKLGPYLKKAAKSQTKPVTMRIYPMPAQTSNQPMKRFFGLSFIIPIPG